MQRFERNSIATFAEYLRQQERSQATIDKYTHALQRFYVWLPIDKCVDKQRAMEYKRELARSHAPASVNADLAALNGFFRFLGWFACVLKPMCIQRRLFCAVEKELCKEEYERLVRTAEQQGKLRLSLLLQLMASTGLRVSEVQYVTVDAIQQRCVSVHLKGKVRMILLPNKLCGKLKKFCRRMGITTGPVFVTSSGRPMSRKSIWAQMKGLCQMAGVLPAKVFPHNLRHLFARTFYRVQKDIAKLADLLGHSSVETTRIYLLSSGTEHRSALERLRLIC